jgi:hypothetical protein
MASMNRDLQAHKEPDEYIVPCFIDPDVKGVDPSISVLAEIIFELLREPADSAHDDLQPYLIELIYTGDHLSTSRMQIIESKIRHSLRGHEKLCIIIDGLEDHYEDADRYGTLIALLERLCRYDPNHHIKCVLSGHSNRFQGRAFECEPEIDLNTDPRQRENLERYICDSLQSGKLDRKIHVVERLAREIARNSAGAFLRARLVMEELRASIDRNPEPLNVREMITSLDRVTIFDLYDKMLGRIKVCDRGAALSMLRWVTYSARPLHIRELLGALNFETGIEIEGVNTVQNCCGLLSIDDDGLVRLVHSSVRGYLWNRMKQSWRDVSDEANEIIAKTCLKALNPERLFQSLNLSSVGCEGNSDSEETIDVPPFFEDYAQGHWIFHYRLAEASSNFLAGALHSSLETSLRKLKASVRNGPQEAAAQYIRETRHRHSVCCVLNQYTAGLLIGARFGFPKLAKLELEMGANVDIVCGSDQRTPLIWAAMNGHIQVVQLLLLYGADSELKTTSGDNALVFAKANGHSEIVKLLLAQVAQKMDLDEDEGVRADMEELSLGVSFKSAYDIHVSGATETV